MTMKSPSTTPTSTSGTPSTSIPIKRGGVKGRIFLVVNSLIFLCNVWVFLISASTVTGKALQNELRWGAPPPDVHVMVKTNSIRAKPKLLLDPAIEERTRQLMQISNEAKSLNGLSPSAADASSPTGLRRQPSKLILDPSIEKRTKELMQISLEKEAMKNSNTAVPPPTNVAKVAASTITETVVAKQSLTTPSATTTTTTTAKKDAPKNPTAPTTKKKPTLVITGLVKDAQQHLRKLERAIRRVTRDDFELEHLIFYDSASTDKTVDGLQRWKTSWAKNLTVISEKTEVLPKREGDRLARGRNMIMKEVLKLPNIDKIDYVLTLDMNEVNYQLSNVAECLNLPQGFGACCANQYKVYSDLYALRTNDDWLSFDLWKSPLATRIMINDKYRHIPASADPIPVKSCYGGAALYNVSAIKHLPLDTMYRGSETDLLNTKRVHRTSEHVPFNKEIQRQVPDYKFMIQPRFLNDGPSDTFIPLVKARQLRQAEYLQSWSDPRSKEYYKGMTA